MGKYRNGQTFIGIWVPDNEYENWKKLIPGNLSEYVRQAVDDKLTRDGEKRTLEAEVSQVHQQKAELEQMFSTRFEELKKFLITSTTNASSQIPAIKSRILKFLEVIKRPSKWEEIVDVVGESKDLVLSTLQDLFVSKMVQVNRAGDYFLGGYDQ